MNAETEDTQQQAVAVRNRWPVAHWLIGALNLLCAPIMLIGPVLAPMHSGMSMFERALLPIGMAWLWGPGLGFWISYLLYRWAFTDHQLRRRELYLDYYPLWSVGSFALFLLLWPGLALLGIG